MAPSPGLPEADGGASWQAGVMLTWQGGRDGVHSVRVPVPQLPESQATAGQSEWPQHKADSTEHVAQQP